MKNRLNDDIALWHWVRARQAKGGTLWGSYWKNRSLFFLDGTIITVGENRYFEDKSAADRHFLITGYDFASDWTTGFPYKSAATISAPAGDAALIAADINNFLYDAGGTPNQIPVVSLFQDIDYEHKIFCKHVAQVLDGNGVETYEPRVSHIYMATAVLSGADLTLAQSDFSVPTEDATAKWCSPAVATPPGLDANAGTKAAPDLTIQHAIDSENTGKTVYFKTNGDFNPAYGRIDSNNKNQYLNFIGYCRTIDYDGTHILRVITGANFKGMEGLIMAPGASVSRLLQTLACIAGVFKRNYLKLTGGQTMGPDFKDVLNTVFTGTYNTSYGCLISTGGSHDRKIAGNFFGGTDQYFDIKINTTPGDVEVSNNKFNCTLRVNEGQHIFCDKDNTGSILIKGNYFKNSRKMVAPIYAQGNRATSDFNIEICYNTFDLTIEFYKSVELLEHQVNVPYVHHNRFNITGFGRGISFHAGNIRAEYNIIDAHTMVANYGDDFDGDVQNGEVIAAALEHHINNNLIRCNRSSATHINIGYSTTDADNKIAAEITKNKIQGYGVFNATVGSASAIKVAFQKDADIRYNWLEGAYRGVELNGATAWAANGVHYNIIKNCERALNVTGDTDAPHYNNTIISNKSGAYGIYCNTGSTGVFKNNIIILTATGTVYGARDSGAAASVFDYNIYYVPNGTLRFQIAAADKTWAEWQAAGYDAHSIVLTAGQYATLFTDVANDDFSLPAGSVAIGAGETLDAAYDDGLDASTDWGDDDTVPTVVTKQQGAAWDCGAYIH